MINDKVNYIYTSKFYKKKTKVIVIKFKLALQVKNFKKEKKCIEIAVLWCFLFYQKKRCTLF